MVTHWQKKAAGNWRGLVTRLHFMKCWVLNTPNFPSLLPCCKTFPQAADPFELFQLSNRTEPTEEQCMTGWVWKKNQKVEEWKLEDRWGFNRRITVDRIREGEES